MPFQKSTISFDLPAHRLRDLLGDTDLVQFLEANDTIAFLVFSDDLIVYEQYFQGHTPSSLSQAFSMTKSFMSTLVGMAIEDGYLGGVDQRVTDLIPELSDAGFDRVTIQDLLTMMSGSSYVENDNPLGEHVILNYSPQLRKQILSFEMEADPGAIFRYKSGDNALLALMLERALGGETITAYAQRRLWDPMGMEHDAIWTIDHEGDGLELTWCCLAATARDFAKLGRLYLDNGIVNGTQVLSSDWIRQSSRTAAVPEDRWPEDLRTVGLENYGYQWWLLSGNDQASLALGKDGQYLYVNPARDILILRLGWSVRDVRTSQWIELFNTIAEEGQ